MSISVGAKFGMPIHKQMEASSKLALPYAKVGIEIECEGVTTLADPEKLLAYWQTHEDRSLRNHGMEFVTRGGLVGKDLLKAISDICTYFSKSAYNVGYPRAGIHLHIDVTDMNDTSNTQLLNMVLAYMIFEKAVFKFAGEWREACGFCDPLYLSQRDFPNISKLLHQWDSSGVTLNERNFSKYQAINFLPMARFGTVEFRHLPTTFDEERIVNWINLCLCFKRYGMVTDIDPVEYMDRYGAKALMHEVFGNFLPNVTQYIVEKDLIEASLEARSLRVGTKTPPLLDSWETFDSPILLDKMEFFEKKAKKKPTAAQAAEALGLEPMPQLDAQIDDRRDDAVEVPALLAGWQLLDNGMVEQRVDDTTVEEARIHHERRALQTLHEMQRQMGLQVPAPTTRGVPPPRQRIAQEGEPIIPPAPRRVTMRRNIP